MHCSRKKRILSSVKTKGSLPGFLGKAFLKSLSTFQAQWNVVNDLLMTKRSFLRVYELRKKFCYLIKKVPKTKNVVKRDLSAFIEERFNGFEIVRKLTEDQRKENFQLIDIVYKPVSKISQTINCYFSKSKRNAYRIVSGLKKGKGVTSADQCFTYNKFFIQKKYLEKHLQVCSSMPGMIYRFENQSMQKKKS